MQALWGKIAAFIMALLTMAGILSGVVNPGKEPFVPGGGTTQLPQDDTVVLIENGASAYRIVRGASASPSEQYAAQTLQRYLEQISGVRLPIATDAEPQEETEIIVGKTNREGAACAVDRSRLGDDGLTVKMAGQTLVIADGEKRGTLYGVYAFLEEALGCRWYTGDLWVIPQRAKVEVPAGLAFEQIPVFQYRETDWISPMRSTEYRIANRLNGAYGHQSEAQGGNIPYTGGLCHTMASLLPASLFNEHPEYFALGSLSGKRTTDQPCLSNPETLRIVTQNVLNLLQAHPDAKIISVTQNDNMNFCVCDKCLATDLAEGSHAGTMLRFVNAVAKAVDEAGYHDVMIDTFAYQYTRTAPKITKPRRNVVVRICTIENCFAHPLGDPGCDWNRLLTGNFDDWAALTDNIHVWDYTTDYYNYLGPFPNFGVLQKNMQFFRDHHVTGVYEEGNYSAGSSNTEFAELRAYLLARLMWNPDMDYDAEMNGFLKAYYGAGWQYVREYIDMTSRKTGAYPLHNIIYSSMLNPGVLLLTDNEVAYMDELWAAAKRLCETPWQLRNIELSELSWRYWKGCNMRGEFEDDKGSGARAAAHEKLYNDMVAAGVTRFSELKPLTQNPDFKLAPYTWGN